VCVPDLLICWERTGITTAPSRPGAVIGGVDTHADIHVAAACNHLGAVLGADSFPTTPVGYRPLLAFLISFGQLESVGVEGTGSYGSGLARHLADAGVRTSNCADAGSGHRRCPGLLGRFSSARR